MKTKIFIVDDHYMVIEGIRSLLDGNPSIEWMGHATHAASCLAFLKQQLPDVILMDINLPDLSGIELCREVRTLYPSVFIIGLSTFNQQSFIQKMLDNGASGYLLKNATRESMLEGIEAVRKGRLFMSPEASQVLNQPAAPDSPIITRREQEVLGLIAEGMTNNEISQKLFISITTVDSHRKNLLGKFKAKNTATLIRMAAHLKLI